MKKLLSAAALSLVCVLAAGQQTLSLDNDWTFALGDASSMQADFTHGTEYFTYYCKAQSTGGSLAPITLSFDDSEWQKVSLPHDWVVDLPYSGEASHSHGYKCIGWKYPQNSVGWYRKHIYIPESEKGKQISIEFEGIFRDSQVFCNGFYLGHEVSGYSSRVYTLTPYLNYGGDNVIAVRCDASTEEGWYYEGAGIYRHVRLHSAGPVALKPYSLSIQQKCASDSHEWTLADGTQSVYVDASCINMQYILADASANLDRVSRKIAILDASGAEVSRAEHLWSIEDPYLYTLRVSLFYDGVLSDEYSCRFGVRTLEFSASSGLLVNGNPLKLKGCDLHLDHAGVGVAVPDELWRYRIQRLKSFGFNAIRCSHNCASPSMLALCDELGMAVIDENRQIGVNEQLGQLQNMIDRDRNHPSVFLWSIGNEEWAVEYNQIGYEIALRMKEFVHSLDLTRPVTYGNCSGQDMVKALDVFGYNYIRQNEIDKLHSLFPSVCAVGTEETSGCGTRGVYETVPEKGWMTPINRVDSLKRVNIIEDGWKFYKARPWAIGVCYWTGFDYRGEPNPMKWPATGSQYGIFDYCGFPKDEAFYLKAAWTAEPVVHICGPYDGEVWVYSNCDEVKLMAGRKSLGTKKMPEDGHLVWNVSDPSAVFSAVGYRSGRKVASDRYPAVLPGAAVASSASAAAAPASSATAIQSLGRSASNAAADPAVAPARDLDVILTPSKTIIAADGQDVVVIDICTSLPSLEVRVENGELLGWGNGDPGFKAVERPAGKIHAERNTLTVTPFNGYAQILVRSLALDTAVAASSADANDSSGRSLALDTAVPASSADANISLGRFASNASAELAGTAAAASAFPELVEGPQARDITVIVGPQTLTLKTL